MKSFLRRLYKITAYTIAGVVILLAIAVGLFRLFLPRLPEYQEDIKGWASTAIGMEVDFSGMDARWGLSGPELEFYEAQLIRPDINTRVVAAEEVRISVALTRLLVDRTLVIDRVVIRDTSIELRQLDDGNWWVQGMPAKDWEDTHSGGARNMSDIEIIGEDIDVIYLQAGAERPTFFDVTRAAVSIDRNRIAVDAEVRLPDDLGRDLSVSATQIVALPEEDRRWDVVIEADDVDLLGWSALQTGAERHILSGSGDVDLSVAYARGQVRNASADVELTGIQLKENEPFDLGGRLEFNMAADGWLVAAEEFRISTTSHDWPESSLRAEVSTDEEGRIVMMDARASYLNLDDAGLFDPLLSEVQQQQLREYNPSGIIHDLVATVSDFDSESPRFDISAELQGTGIAALGKRPGIRGLSGVLRANRLGGRVEIRSTGMVVDLKEFVAEPINIDAADGTVIWRSSDSGTTVLSDSIRIRNDFFDSQSNLQLVIGSDDSSPEIDLASTWSITDIAAAKRYIPQKIVKPNLYDWFQSALVSGSIPQGATRLYGPLDKFPFDNDEGRLLLEGSLRNLTFKYAPRWPAAQESDMEIVLDNMRLYSERNRSVSAGNTTVDAKIEIADLRNPVLRIQSFSTGTLESIRMFSRRSPISDIFGGQLDLVSVAGDASITLDLTIPLKSRKEFQFESIIRTNNGTLSVAGFPPPLTGLAGSVTITNDDISSESLGARFLGQEVYLNLATSDDPRFRVVATTNGFVTAAGITGELGLPLEGLISGGTEYEARVLFPSDEPDTVSPLVIQIDTDLDGLGLDFPEPVAKLSTESMPVRGDIRFMPGGEVIESAGFADNGIAWQIAFNRDENAWDFDRGAVSMGGDTIAPAETRGLHIRGNASTVRLEDWLSLSRSGEKKTGVAERIRSIDLIVDNLYAVGQHLLGHRVRVDRSALDWLVQLDGDDIVGSVFVPYDFGSERAMVLEMERMRLPGSDEVSDEPSNLDPRTLPPITVTADDAALGDRNFGAVELRLERVADGLEATTIETKDETFEITGNGRWLADETNALGSRTEVTATLASSNVMQTMDRLNFTPGIVSDEMNALIDLSWSGEPRADFLNVLDGEVQVQFGEGQLEEVEPGVGRVFGLMSIVALPKRLSLDFSDVFNKGFGFDEIAGTFRIVDGESYTCDLSLEGPAADIGIVGRASLVNRDYDQVAIVSANVGNTLPIVGAVVAGPQVAAALLIFSQIFKKPLQEVGQVYYAISGSWDEPKTNSTNSEDFASHSELAGCLTSAE